MRSKEILETVQATETRLDVLQRGLEQVVQYLAHVDGMLVTREPNTALAAEAYEGLRRQVAAGAKARRAHLAQLARMQQAIERLHRRADDDEVTASEILANLDDLLEQWIKDAGLEAVSDPGRTDLYEVEIVEGDWETGHDVVVAPAFVDNSDPSNPVPIERGRLVRRVVASKPEEAEAAPAEDSTVPGGEQPAEAPASPEPLTIDDASEDDKASDV